MNRAEIEQMMIEREWSSYTACIDFQIDTVDWEGIVNTIANALTEESFTINYRDRFAIPMLTTRKLLLEQHCLMAQAREVEEQIRAVREWQLAHLGLLTPLPGAPPSDAAVGQPALRNVETGELIIGRES